jgi:hypothetical protein
VRPRRGGAIALIFESLDVNNESRVVTGAPEDWRERSDVLEELFAATAIHKKARSAR